MKLLRNILSWAIAVFVLVLAVNHEPGTPPLGPLDGLTHTITDTAGRAPRKTPDMTDLQWCLLQAAYWEDSGVEVPDDSECQGQPMSHWRTLEGNPA